MFMVQALVSIAWRTLHGEPQSRDSRDGCRKGIGERIERLPDRVLGVGREVRRSPHAAAVEVLRRHREALSHRVRPRNDWLSSIIP